MAPSGHRSTDDARGGGDGHSRRRGWWARALPLAGLAVLAAAASATAAPLPSASVAEIDRIVGDPRYQNASWGIAVRDAATGETVYERNADHLRVPGSLTKLFTGAAALQALGPDRRFVTPVHRIGRVEDGRVSTLALVASGDFSFGLRGRRDGTLAFSLADHNNANALQNVSSVRGQPLRALRALARDVRRSGVREVGEVAIDDRLFTQFSGWPDGTISPMWVNENLIDITVRATARGRAAKVSSRPRTPAYRVVSRVRTGTETDLRLREPRKGVIRVDGTIADDEGSTVRTWTVDEPADFARTAFIRELRRAGVAVEAEAVAPNPTGALPRARTYPTRTRVARWVSPAPFSEYVNVVFKLSYNRGADLMACLVGVAGGTRSCENGLARVTDRVIGLGVRGDRFFNFDGAGSLESNSITPGALNDLVGAARTQAWGGAFRAGLPVLGVPGGGSLAFLGTESPARGRFFAKTGTRIISPPGSPGGVLAARGLSGYLEGASGREYLVTIIVNGVPFVSVAETAPVSTDQIDIVDAIYRGT